MQEIKKNIILIVLILFLILWLIIPRPITSANYFSEKFKEYEKRYYDISLYNSRCNEVEIMMVGVRYAEKNEIKKCKEWIMKRDICISLHPEYNDVEIQGTSEICKLKK